MIGDASVELGRYQQGFAAFARLGHLRPGLVAYARLSYARELQGDVAGATRLMRRAVDAGSGAPENTQWTRVQLAALLLKSGHTDAAAREYRHALALLPNYARAEAGLGAVAVARGNLGQAERWYDRAASHLPLPDIVAQLGDVREARGDSAGAREAYALVRVEQALFVRAGGNADLETALFEASHPGAMQSRPAVVALARKALAFRPSIYGHDALAWALYAGGKCRQALPQALLANRLGTVDPQLSWHLGAIAACAGKPALARSALQRALARTPHFHPLDAPAARRLLARLPMTAKWHARRVPFGLLRALLVASLALAAIVPAASAHPLGNFTVNQYTRLDLAETDVSVRYVLDMAEIPTFQRRQHRRRRRRRAHLGRGAGAGARPAGRDRRSASASARRRQAGRLALEDARVAFPQGQGGLSTTRLDARFRAVGAGARRLAADVRARPTATPPTAWAGASCSSRATAASPCARRTRRWAIGRERSPTTRPTCCTRRPTSAPRRRWRRSAPAASRCRRSRRTTPRRRPMASSSAKSDGGFVSLIENGGDLTLFGALAALGLALVFGMFHALTPGHGKTMVAAYLVGTRGRARHALVLGGTVTITHTAGVFALGLVTLSLSQFIVPEQLYPWLNLASGVMVVAIGAFAIRDRLRRWLRAARPRRAVAATPTGTITSTRTTTATTTPRTTTDTITATATRTRRPISSRCARSSPSGVSGGLLPCPSALVVLLSAIALHRLAFGLALIVAFSFGLASVISGIGLAVLYARKLFMRLPSDHGRIVQVLPVASAVIITVLGLVLTARSLPGVM